MNFNSSNNRSKREFLRLLWDIVVFRLIGCVFAEYDLFNITNLIQKSYIYTFWYNFDTDLYPFLETGTSDRCLIVIVQRLRFSVSFNHGNSLDQFGKNTKHPEHKLILGTFI